MVSTLDRRLCAEMQRVECASERVSVMGSSLIALGGAIAREHSHGACDIIISENANGLVLFNHIDEDFVLISQRVQERTGLVVESGAKHRQKTAVSMPKVAITQETWRERKAPPFKRRPRAVEGCGQGNGANTTPP